MHILAVFMLTRQISQTEDYAEGKLERACGPNHERLVALKSKFDPTNFLHLNISVRPGT